MPESSTVSDIDQATPAQYNNLRTDALKIWAQGSSELTISSGAITVGTNGFYTVDTEGDASSDDLDTISGGETGEIILLGAENAGRTVVVKHNTGNIHLSGEQDCPLVDVDQVIMLRYNGTDWIEVSAGADRLMVFGAVLGNGVSLIASGTSVPIPFVPQCYLLGLYAIADASGSVNIDVRSNGSFGIPDSGDKIEDFDLSSQQSKSDTTLSGVTREQAAGSWEFITDGAATTIKQVSVVALAVKL